MQTWHYLTINYAVYTMQCIKNKQVPPLQTDGASINIVSSFTRSRDTSWRTVALNSLMFYSNNMNDSQRLSHVKISIVNMSHAWECGKIISYCTSWTPSNTHYGWQMTFKSHPGQRQTLNYKGQHCNPMTSMMIITLKSANLYSTPSSIIFSVLYVLVLSRRKEEKLYSYLLPFLLIYLTRKPGSWGHSNHHPYTTSYSVTALELEAPKIQIWGPLFTDRGVRGFFHRLWVVLWWQTAKSGRGQGHVTS